MRKFFTVAAALATIWTNAQETEQASVEKSVFGIQTGVIGLWVHHEAKLTRTIALRSEVGLDLGYWYSDLEGVSGHFIVPSLTVEPRWYYNLDKRTKKGYRTDGNSGNYVSLRGSFYPDMVVSSSVENARFVPQLFIGPMWGIRRNLGKHFNYEAGAGLVYVQYFPPSDVFMASESDVDVLVHLRIGYKF